MILVNLLESPFLLGEISCLRMVWKTFVMNQLALSVLFNILTTEHKSTMILLKNTQKLTLIKELRIHLTLSMLKTFQISLQWNHTVCMSTLRKKIDMFAIYISSRVKTILKMKHEWETQKLIALFSSRNVLKKTEKLL